MLLLFISIGNAEYTIIDVVPSKISSNTGAITMRIDGTAGPFTITLQTSAGQPVSPYILDDVINPVYGMNNLATGDYMVLITDKFGCEEKISIKVPSTCDFNIRLIDIAHVSNCNEASCANDGSIVIEEQSGLFYKWNGRTIRGAFTSATASIYNLVPGTYELTVTGNGCSEKQVFEIMDCSPKEYLPIEPKLLSLMGSPDPMRCTGHIHVELPNVNDQAIYYWLYQDQRISESTILTELCFGDYTLVIDDGCGTHKEYIYTITTCMGDPLVIEAETLNVNGRCTDNLGMITIKVTGGVVPFFYTWSNGRKTQTIEDLRQGDYSVTVVDGCGSEAIVGATIACDCKPIQLISDDPCFDKGIFDFDFDGTEAELEFEDDDIQDEYRIDWWDKTTSYIRRIGRQVFVNGADEKDIPTPHDLSFIERCITITNTRTYCSYVDCAYFQKVNPALCQGPIKEHVELPSVFSSDSKGMVYTGYLIENDFCFAERDLDKVEFYPFIYRPFDMNNPCTGGGEILNNPCSNLLDPSVIIPPTASAFVSSFTGFSFMYENELAQSSGCSPSTRSGCIFEDIAVFGFDAGVPILVTFCPGRVNSTSTSIFVDECVTFTALESPNLTCLHEFKCELKDGQEVSKDRLVGDYRFCKSVDDNGATGVFCPSDCKVIFFSDFSNLDPDYYMDQIDSRPLPFCDCLLEENNCGSEYECGS